MHGLDIIVARNAYAAGREAAHAANDGNAASYLANVKAGDQEPANSALVVLEVDHYLAGLDAGRQEG